MDTPLIVIADEDKKYIYPLLAKIIGHYRQAVEVAVFTEKYSLDEYLKSCFKISVMVISENLDIRIPDECQISHQIILTDRNIESQSYIGENKEIFFYRYSPLELLFHVISSYCGEIKEQKQDSIRKTSVILVNSVAGGVGKTVVAMALAMNLRSTGKKALYLDAEWLQNFVCYLEHGRIMDREGERAFLHANGKSEQVINSFIHIDNSLEYLSQMNTPLIFLDKSPQVYINCVTALKEAGDYDYLIVDTDETIDSFKVQLMSLCDQMVLVTTAQKSSDSSTQRFLQHISMTKDKTYVVYNKISEDRKNSLQCSYAERVSSIIHLPQMDLPDEEMLVALATQKELQKLVLMLM